MNCLFLCREISPLLLVQIHWYNSHHVVNIEAHSLVEESVVKFKQHRQREMRGKYVPISYIVEMKGIQILRRVLEKEGINFMLDIGEVLFHPSPILYTCVGLKYLCTLLSFASSSLSSLTT